MEIFRIHYQGVLQNDNTQNLILGTSWCDASQLSTMSDRDYS